MALSLRLTRAQLAQFLTDFEQIKQFEKLFALVDQDLNSGEFEATIIASGNADAKAQQALDELAGLARSLDRGPPMPDLMPIMTRLQALEMEPRPVDYMPGGASIFSIRELAASATVNATDYALICDCTAGAITVTLPPAAACRGRTVQVKKVDAGANAVTVEGDGAETIDGAANISWAVQYQSYSLICDGVEWWII